MNKIKTILIVIVCSTIISGCKFKQSDTSSVVKELSIPLKEYNILIEINQVEYGNDRVEFNDYYYWYNMTKTLFMHKWIDSDKVLIRFHDFVGMATPERPKDKRMIPLDNVMLIYLSQKRNCNTKCCYIKWKNDDYLDEKGIKWRYSDLDIGKSTIKLETNIDSLVIKNIYPDLKCAVEFKKYKNISIDYYYDMRFLDFFKHIKFEE
jgi:hypothetical protein